jgi:hypothetical protein
MFVVRTRILDTVEDRGAFGSNVNHFPNGTVICDRECYDNMCAQDAQDFYKVSFQSPSSAGCYHGWRNCCFARRLSHESAACGRTVGQGGSKGCSDCAVELGRMCRLQRFTLHPSPHMLYG